MWIWTNYRCPPHWKDTCFEKCIYIRSREKAVSISTILYKKCLTLKGHIRLSSWNSTIGLEEYLRACYQKQHRVYLYNRPPKLLILYCKQFILFLFSLQKVFSFISCLWNITQSPGTSCAFKMLPMSVISYLHKEKDTSISFIFLLFLIWSVKSFEGM